MCGPRHTHSRRHRRRPAGDSRCQGGPLVLWRGNASCRAKVCRSRQGRRVGPRREQGRAEGGRMAIFVILPPLRGFRGEGRLRSNTRGQTPGGGPGIGVFTAGEGQRRVIEKPWSAPRRLAAVMAVRVHEPSRAGLAAKASLPFGRMSLAGDLGSGGVWSGPRLRERGRHSRYNAGAKQDRPLQLLVAHLAVFGDGGWRETRRARGARRSGVA